MRPLRDPWVWGKAVLLLLAIVVAYWPALHAGWVWDDDDYVTRNPNLDSLAGLARIWFVPGATPQYYPLVHTTFWLEYQVWGLWPAGFHATNVALHAMSAVVLWRTLVLLGFPAALWAAALWALHPVQVESVAWVTERKNTLSGFFFLLATYTVVSATIAGRRPWRGATYVLGLVLHLAALLTKTVTATWPVIMALVWWGRNGRLHKEWLLRLLPALGAGAVLATVTVHLERSHVGALGPDWDLSWTQRVIIASRALWFYLGKLLWPSNLTFIYPRWEVSGRDPLEFLWLAATLLALAVLVATLRWVGRWPLVAGWSFVVLLGPALGFVDVFPMRYSFVADHYQYLASIAPVTLLVCGSAALVQARWAQSITGWVPRLPSAALQVPGVLLSIVLATLSGKQAGVYRDAETLWRDTVKKNPRAWMAHNNLGLLLLERGHLREAERHFEQALAAKPDDSFAMNNLGLVLSRRGELQRAAEWFARAVEIDPTQAEAANNLGNVFAQTGQWSSAEGAYRVALQRRPNYADAWNNLGNVLALQGRLTEALQAYERALSLDPLYLDAILNVARVLADLGDTGQAQAWIERARQIDPRDPRVEELQEELARRRPPGSK